MFKINNKNTRTTPLTMSIVKFEQENADWVMMRRKIKDS